MKLIQILPLAALSTAFVIPDEKVMSQVAIESHRSPKSTYEKLPCKDKTLAEIENTIWKVIDTSKSVIDTSKSAFDQAIDYAAGAGEKASTKAYESASNVQAWLDSAAERVEDIGKHELNSQNGHVQPNLT